MRIVVACLTLAIAMSGGAFAGMKGGHDLSDEELRSEMSQNRALAAYVNRNGMPDVAETRFLADRPPWDDHEVALYYLDSRTEIRFARALILGRPEIQLVRFQRRLSEDDVEALAPRVRNRPADMGSTDQPSAPPAPTSAMRPVVEQVPVEPQPEQAEQAEQTTDQSVVGPADRAEAAAARAEAAADRLEAIADSAEEAASRAESVTVRAVSAHIGEK